MYSLYVALYGNGLIFHCFKYEDATKATRLKNSLKWRSLM